MQCAPSTTKASRLSWCWDLSLSTRYFLPAKNASVPYPAPDDSTPIFGTNSSSRQHKESMVYIRRPWIPRSGAPANMNTFRGFTTTKLAPLTLQEAGIHYSGATFCRNRYKTQPMQQFVLSPALSQPRAVPTSLKLVTVDPSWLNTAFDHFVDSYSS